MVLCIFHCILLL